MTKSNRKIYNHRTNSGDGDSLCSTKLNDTSDSNCVTSSNEATANPLKLHWKQKRKLKLLKSKSLSKSLSSECHKELEYPDLAKRQRTESVDKIQAAPLKFSMSSISPNSTSSSSNNSSDTAISKIGISVSTTRDGMESSSDNSSEHSFKEKSNNTILIEDDPFEPRNLDMSSQENSNVLKTLFLEKSEFIEKKETDTSANTAVNVDIESVLKQCKISLGLENAELLTSNHEMLKEIKKESSSESPELNRREDLIDYKKEVLKEAQKTVDDYKKLINEKSKKEMDTIKQDFDRLIREMQYNSGLFIEKILFHTFQVNNSNPLYLDVKIREIIVECTKEKLKMQKTYEKLLEETKRKQWVNVEFKS